jgi:hypothetical protein
MWYVKKPLRLWDSVAINVQDLTDVGQRVNVTILCVFSWCSTETKSTAPEPESSLVTLCKPHYFPEMGNRDNVVTTGLLQGLRSGARGGAHKGLKEWTFLCFIYQVNK